MPLDSLPNGHGNPYSSSTSSASTIPQIGPHQQVLDSPSTAQKNSLQGWNSDESDQRKISHPEKKDLPGGWVVQKFGGTSVGKSAKEIAEIIRVGLLQNRVAVVCSARSSTEKKEGTTNRLLRAAREAEKLDSPKYADIVEAIRNDHIHAAEVTVKDSVIVEHLKNDIDAECDGLVRLLESARHLAEVSHATRDKIISKGEKMSCLYMTAVLQDSGIDAKYVDLADILRPASPSTTDKLDEAFYKRVARAIVEETHRICGNSVPVITGYFGNVPGGLLRAVGRGYSDLCAALVAVELKAKELQVWKEIDGVYTADPRRVPTARLLSSVTPSEAAELTFYGSEVIHPFVGPPQIRLSVDILTCQRTMEQVIRARIPIRVRNVLNPRNSGTVIVPDPLEELDSETLLHDSRLFRPRSKDSDKKQQFPKRPTAVTIKRDIVILNCHSNKRTRAHGFLMNIFSVLDKWHLSVDLISSSEVHVSMALHSEAAMLGGGTDEEASAQNADLLSARNELRLYGSIDLIPNMAIVSLVGKQLKNMVGISGRFLSTLGSNNINIEMISQGASEINISCVIDERDADRALNVVHTHLFTFLE